MFTGQKSCQAKLSQIDLTSVGLDTLMSKGLCITLPMQLGAGCVLGQVQCVCSVQQTQEII